MTRDELKNKLNGLIDEIIPEDRELSDDDENSICDQFGDVAADMLNDTDEDAEGDAAS